MSEEVKDETVNYIADIGNEEPTQEVEENVVEKPKETTEESKAEEANTEGETTEETPEEQPVKKPSRAEKRIKSLLKQKYDLLDKLKQYENKPEEEVSQNVDEIDPEDFDDFEDYLAAVEAAEEVEEPQQVETEEPAENSAEDLEYQKTLEELQIRFETSEAVKKHPDFIEKVTDPAVPITPPMVLGMAELDNPEDVAYYLANNPDKALAIANLSPAKQLVEMGRIEAALKTGSTKQTKPQEADKTITPIKDVGETIVDIDNMPFKEYERTVNKLEQEGKWG